MQSFSAVACVDTDDVYTTIALHLYLHYVICTSLQQQQVSLRTALCCLSDGDPSGVFPVCEVWAFVAGCSAGWQRQSSSGSSGGLMFTAAYVSLCDLRAAVPAALASSLVVCEACMYMCITCHSQARKLI